MAKATVTPSRDAQQIAALLRLPEVEQLISDLDATRWTGRPGYPIRTMIGVTLVKSVYVLPTWTRTVRLVAEHDALREAVGGVAPSVYACYRFAAKLREHGDVLGACLDRLLGSLREQLPEMGEHLAIDGSDLPAYANGQRYVSKGGPERERYSDPDASWGHRSAVSTRKGGGYYGYKVHAAVCTRTGLPIDWQVQTASESEHEHMPGLLDAALDRGFTPETAALDKGYDGRLIYEACESRGVHPVIPLRRTVSVDAGWHLPPSCGHGQWTFAGSDSRRQASKWRCPTGKCTPRSIWVKADRLRTLIPRTTERWRSLYRERVAVEREFGVLKHEWAMLPLRVRRIARVRLHVDLTILARLGHALIGAQAALPAAA